MFRLSPGDRIFVCIGRNTVAAPPVVVSEAREPGIFAALVFAGLLFGLVKGSWFGIFPYLATLIGPPRDLVDQAGTALLLGLFIGAIAYAALHLADRLSTLAKSALPRWFARTGSALPTKHRSPP